jgi:diguanylate cyclase (GGDEF)-like protein/PAS domain S-box-containing protein
MKARAPRVLLVDDDPEHCASAVERLRADFPGVEVLTFTTAEAASPGVDGEVDLVVSCSGNREELATTVRALLARALKRRQVEEDLRASEERNRHLLAQIPAVLWTTDRDLRLTSSLGRGLATLGRDSEQTRGMSLYEYFGTGDGTFLPIAAHWAALRGEPRSYEQEWVGRIYETHVEPLLDAAGQIAGCIGVALDITGRKRAEHALRESEERYALAMSGANAGLWDWDLDSEVVYFSARFRSILGYSQDEIGSSPSDWLKRVHPEDVRALDAALAAHLAGLTPQLECEHRVVHKDGRYRWMLCRGLSVRDPDGRAVRMTGALTDITERKLSEQQLLHDAFHDVLTGLPNRALYMDRLERSLARATRNPEHRVAVLFLDLDRFKLINDSLGHLMGDRLLAETARRLERCLRPEDTVARLGGDEFALLLEGITAVGDAVRVAERIQQQLKRPVTLGGHEVFAAGSIGISLSAPGGGRAEDLVRDADTAMFRSKALGSGQPVVFDAVMHVDVLARLKIETSLRQAIEREELSLHFQPIVDLKTGRLAEVEALARWREEIGGSPAEFIPVAEETGLIVPLGHWVLAQACRQMADWHQRFPEREDLSVSVNLSSKQFAQPDLIARIDEILLESGLSGERLTVEITESVLMENSVSASTMLRELRSRGVRLCIDDFGTGYSSLSYLHNFDLHRLKLDHTFVSPIVRSPRNLEIVRAVVTLAHNLGMQVIAEGVEDADQLARLVELGCDYGQGFLFCRPAAACDLEALLGSADTLLAPSAAPLPSPPLPLLETPR